MPWLREVVLGSREPFRDWPGTTTFCVAANSKYFSSHLIFFWRRQWHPTPVLLPGKSHGQRSLIDCSPWGCEESDTTERLHFPFSLSCIGEGNGNPLQCSCLESPRDGGAWWAAVYGVAQSRTQLKRLSSSSLPSSSDTEAFKSEIVPKCLPSAVLILHLAGSRNLKQCSLIKGLMKDFSIKEKWEKKRASVTM